MSEAVGDGSDDGGRSAAVIVAHPDDETLWAGGMILMHPKWRWRIVTLCRGDDSDRSPKFRMAIEHYGAEGWMGVLDDGPQQLPLASGDVQSTIVSLLGDGAFDLVVTHSPFGEYSRHRRHEEVAAGVGELWSAGTISAGRLWMFAYDDDGGSNLPTAIVSAHRRIDLPDHVWHRKYRIITEVYGFGADSFEAKTTPRTEGFWCFGCVDEYET